MTGEAGVRLGRRWVRGVGGSRTAPTVGSPWEHLAIPCGALLVGVLTRLPYLLRYDAPLNDGGLFYLMVQELQQSGYRLPTYTAYNGAGIPFAYPPLGLYLAGLIDALGPWSLLDVFRFLPLAFSLLTIPAFWVLARELLPWRAAVPYATLAFPLLPCSFLWLIMGGGLTRSLGLLLALLALWQGYLLFARGGARHLAATAALAAGTVLSHPSMALFLAYSLGLFFLAYGRHRRGLGRAALAAGGAAALSAPWWGTVILRHGVGPLFLASGTSAPLASGLIRLGILALTDEPYFPVLGGLAVLGALASLKARRFFLPIWVLAAFTVDPRKALTGGAMPLAMLAGIGVVEVLIPFLIGDPSPAPPPRYYGADLCQRGRGVPHTPLSGAGRISLWHGAGEGLGWGSRSRRARLSCTSRLKLPLMGVGVGSSLPSHPSVQGGKSTALATVVAPLAFAYAAFSALVGHSASG